MDPLIFFSIAILAVSVVLHEVSHGYAALLLGDPTAKYAKRLTLNPIRHVDPIGSVLVPLFLVVLNAGFLFGWAKPVPINPYNLRGRYGEAIVAFAGPASNIVLAFVFGTLLRFELVSGPAVALVEWIVLINLFLAVFNLVPIPPLDGSRILFAFLPYHQAAGARMALDRYGFFFVIIFVLFFVRLLVPVVFWLKYLLVGY
jgi:Zn-dependent protease